jgi:DNA-binding response OmpR family regulator
MGQTGNSLTVVVAEADADLRKIIAYALRPYSDDILTAQDGYEALNALDEYSPAMMILDLNLPALSVSNLLDSLHAAYEISGLRVILTSSYAGRDITQELPPASTFIQKPYDLAQLRDAIDEQLARV